MEVALVERDERSFNWKVLLENYSENHHEYDRLSYLTVWPNLMLHVFPDAALAMWVEPLSATRTVVHRRIYTRGGTDSAAAAASIAAHRLVHEQDVDVCLRVQRSHNAGVSSAGVLATVEEGGVFWFHQHLRSVFANDGCL